MSTFPTGRKDRIREREKLEKLIAHLEGWRGGFIEVADKAHEVVRTPQHRVTMASAQRREDAKAEYRLAVDAMHDAAEIVKHLKSLLANPLTHPKPIAE